MLIKGVMIEEEEDYQIWINPESGILPGAD